MAKPVVAHLLWKASEQHERPRVEDTKGLGEGGLKIWEVVNGQAADDSSEAPVCIRKRISVALLPDHALALRLRLFEHLAGNVDAVPISSKCRQSACVVSGATTNIEVRSCTSGTYVRSECL